MVTSSSPLQFLYSSSWHLVCPLLVGIGSQATARSLRGGSDQEWREDLRRSTNGSPVSPPPWVFPVVWTVLYALLGVAAARLVSVSGDAVEVDQAMGVYYSMLLLNYAWSPVFFGMRMRSLALVVSSLLALASWTVTRRFWSVDAAAGSLTVPNAAWTTFAVILNAAAVCA